MTNVSNISGQPRYDNVTFLLCNPRSRSAWLHEAMSRTCVVLPHDVLRHCASIDELVARVNTARHNYPGRPVFVADSSMILFVEAVRAAMPGAKFVFVYRAPLEVEMSMRALKLRPAFDPVRVSTKMLRVYQQMRQEGSPPIWLPANMLSYFYNYQALCKHVGCDVMPRAEFDRLAQTNIQADLSRYANEVNTVRTLQLMQDAML